MLDAAELFRGTFLAEVLEICEAGVFDPIEKEVRKGETTIREMTPLEKALVTFLNRCEEKGGKEFKLAESFLWDFLIYPGVTTIKGEPPLGLRSGFVIVEKPPKPIS